MKNVAKNGKIIVVTDCPVKKASIVFLSLHDDAFGVGIILVYMRIYNSLGLLVVGY